MAVNKWSSADIPDQHGKLVVITGSNSGIGYEAALALAGKGAHVVLAVRNQAKGQTAVATIQRRYSQARVEVMSLDLSDLASVRNFASTFQQRFTALPLLINNAGVMALPFRKTVDGFEMQFGTNHLGHFALTGLLLPTILAAPQARVVVISSSLHTAGKIDFSNLNGERSYSPMGAYSQSKLANLLFAYELQRRLQAAGANALAVSCHPGYAATNLQAVGSRMSGTRLVERITELGNRLFAQSAEMGALPTLYAATAPDIHGGEYIGPSGWLGMRGAPVGLKSSKRSHDQAFAAQLWRVSEDLTGVHYTFNTV